MPRTKQVSEMARSAEHGRYRLAEEHQVRANLLLGRLLTRRGHEPAAIRT
jgi:hypothetical protein